VALCRAGTALAVAEVVLGEYAAAGGHGARLVPPSVLR
jgi:hypothetical protein